MKEKIDKIVNFIKTYAGKKSVVLGLSGGLDSSVVAVLAKKALGSTNVHCIYLPEEEKENDFDKKHINKLCERFDLTYQIIPIGKIVKSIISSYDNKLSRITIANIKSRVRMIELYAYANEHNTLVIGTGNKSEIMIGYFTKYGDGGVDFEPLGHLYKTEVFKIAKELDIPNEIVDKPPTAGLWVGQTDESEIGMSYEKIDKILEYLEIRNKWKNNNKKYPYLHDYGLTGKEVNHIAKMVRESKHKRKTPPMLSDNND